MWSADPKVSAATFQGIRGYISGMGSFVFTFLIEGMFVKKSQNLFNAPHVYFV
jgi:uncharacterized membrane protein (DUF485 family)